MTLSGQESVRKPTEMEMEVCTNIEMSDMKFEREDEYEDGMKPYRSETH